MPAVSALLLLAFPAMASLGPRAPRAAPDPSHAAPFAPAQLPSATGSPVDCVILAPDSLADVFQELADYQTRVGIPTVVRPISLIRAADPRSNDLPQAIRSFLRAARDSWGVRWVILAGDHEAIPLRTVEVAFSVTEEIASDAYYADLDGTWDGNGNGIYGEVADSLDMDPDLAVGRLSATTRAEARVLIDKTLRYAVQPRLPALERHLTLAEVLFPTTWEPGQLVQVDGAVQGESLRVRTPGCATMDRLYENHTAYPGTAPLSAASALAALSRGYGIVNHIGHGSRSQISVGSERLSLTDLSSLGNGDSLYLWIGQNCASAAVDYDCVAERIVGQPSGGAFAYIGATRDAWPGVSQALGQACYERFFSGRSVTLGEVVEEARASLLPRARTETQERWGYFETVLLGAPTIPVWRCQPPALAVSRPATVPLDAAGFAVNVSDGGAPVESALVVAWKAPDDYRAVFTDASGIAPIPFHPATPGPFSLAVTRSGHLPYLDSLTVVAAPGAPHFAAAVTGVSDAASGNGDGAADAGEAFSLTGTISNGGDVAASGAVTLLLEATTSGLTVEKGLAVLPVLGAGASTSLPDSLRIRANATPNGTRTEQIRIVLSDGVRADTTEIPVQLVAASLLLASGAFSDAAGGDGDGILEPGETAQFTWEIGNEGAGAARGVTVALVNPAPGTTIVDPSAAVGDIGPGGTAGTPAPGLRVTAGGVATGRLFDLEISDAYGHTWTWPVDAVAPPVPTGLRVEASGIDRITIAWTAPAGAGIAGYRIHRAPDDGSPLDALALPVRRSARFESSGLAPLTRYRFAVSTVDSGGMESPLSAVFVASTTPPVATGWPLATGQSTSSSIALGDLDGDGRPELVVGSEYLYVLRSDGTEWHDGDGVPATTGIFSTALHYIPSSPAIADLDFDGTPEIIAASWNDSLVAVFGADGAIRPGWPRKGEAPFWSSPAVGDIDNDGELEIVIGSNASRLYAWNADGTEVRDGDGNPATQGVFMVPLGNVISSPAIADLDHDSRREILFGTSAGRLYVLHAAPYDTAWIFQAPAGALSSSPAVGDIIPGGGLEVVIASSADSVYVLTSTGARAPGWPRHLELTPGNGRVPSPALAPLRRHLADPSLCVIVAGWAGQVVAWDPQGNVLPGWSSVQLGAPTEASPTAADLDGDGAIEVLIGSEDRRLHAFRADGSAMSGFPIETGAEVRGSAATWDLDGDGSVEIAVAGWDRDIHVWRYAGSFDAASMSWPMFRHDNWRTGLSSFPVLTAVRQDPVPPAPEAPPPARPALLQNRPNPFNPVTVIGLTVPGPGPREVALRVFDVRGRLVATLLSGRLDPGYHDVRWDGRDDRGAPVSSGIYFYRAEIDGTVLTRRMALLK